MEEYTEFAQGYCPTLERTDFGPPPLSPQCRREKATGMTHNDLEMTLRAPHCRRIGIGH